MIDSTRLQPDDIFNILQHANIDYTTYHHPPLRTVADAKALCINFGNDEGQIKNLFLKNKKGKMWLLTIHQNTKIDLKKTAQQLQAKQFSFCSEPRLMTFLGVKPGAVSPFCLLNDCKHEVNFYIDERLMSHQFWYPHPLDNTQTLKIKRQDLLSILEQHGHGYQILTKPST